MHMEDYLLFYKHASVTRVLAYKSLSVKKQLRYVCHFSLSLTLEHGSPYF